MKNLSDNLDSTCEGAETVSDVLGANFELPALPPLTFSTKSRVWGDRSGNACEPTATAFTTPELKQSVLARDNYRCYFCGVPSRANEVHNLNDNHNDVRMENLHAIDFLCHRWQHLGELDTKDAAIVYLPGLSPQDINHLQRTIMVALQSDDADVRSDATKLLNWLASHRDYAERAWGTYDPAVFSDALIRQPANERDFREIVFDGLGVALSPRLCIGAATSWMSDAYSRYPASGWTNVYHGIVNAPL